jgi:TPR repeat protein
MPLPLSIGDYKVVRQLGRGGMGIIFEAIKADQRVAIKTLPSELIGDGFSERQFNQEFNILKRLNHPQIVSAMEEGRDSTVGAYYTMELCEGPTLLAAIGTDGVQPIVAFSWWMKIASGLNSCNSSGVFHRDLHPQNIIFRRPHDPIVIDFGISKVNSDEGPCSQGIGHIDWTPGSSGSLGKPDDTGDTYGLASLLGYLLTGKLPRELLELTNPLLKILGDSGYDINYQFMRCLRQESKTTDELQSAIIEYLNANSKFTAVANDEEVLEFLSDNSFGPNLSKEKINILLKKSQSGHSWAMALLSHCHICGYGVEIDYPKAGRLQYRALVLGDAFSGFNEYLRQKNLSVLNNMKNNLSLYWNGIDFVIPDTIRLSDQMISRNIKFGHHLKGVCLEFQGVTPTGDDPVDFAASRGVEEAIAHQIYRICTRNSTNEERAQAFIKNENLAKIGFIPAQYHSGLMLQHGIGTPINLEKAVERYRLAATRGHPVAHNNLGHMLSEGLGVIRNQEIAIRHFEIASEANLPEALRNLGIAYEQGKGAVPDYPKAKMYYERGCALNDLDSMNNLGHMLYSGKGIKPDHNLAFHLFFRAAINGLPQAMVNVGTAYFFGNGVDQDKSYAIKFYMDACRKNHPDGLFRMGTCYLNGDGIEKNSDYGRHLIIKASQLGSQSATEAIERGLPREYV